MAGKNLTVGFGLVQVPMKLHVIRDEKRSISAKMLCPTHKQPINMAPVCGVGTDDEHHLTREDVLMGYPRPDDASSFVVLDADVLEALGEERTGAATIERTCEVSEIDPLYFVKPYLLEPQKGGEQQFDLLATVLREDGIAALANVVLTRQTVMLAITWSAELGTLVAHIIEYADRIRWKDIERVKFEAGTRAAPKAEYLSIARQLLDGVKGEFDATEVEDTYTTGLVEAIAAAAAGKPIKAGKKAAAAPAGDLMAALTASLKASTAKGKPAARKTKEKAAVK